MNLKNNKFLNYKDYYLIWKLPTYIEMCLSTDCFRSLALTIDWNGKNIPQMEKFS